MYLSRCIDSLLKEESIIQYLEIIIVNDGSTDNSLKIAESYKNLYPQSINIIDKPNGNYGSCINAALKIASGKYFKILDADDWYDTKALATLIEKIKDISVDMIFTAYQTINPEQKVLKQYLIPSQIKKESILSIDDDDIKRLHPRTDLDMHGIAYRTQLLKDIQYTQTEGISYTDSEYVFYPLSHVKSIIFFDLILYQYFVGRSGQTVSVSSRIQHADNLLIMINRIMETPLLSKHKNIYYLQSEYLSHIMSSYYHALLVLQKLTKENKSKLKSLDKRIKEFNPHLYNLLNAIKCIGIPYIKVWRKFHFSIIPSSIYRKLKRE